MVWKTCETGRFWAGSQRVKKRRRTTVVNWKRMRYVHVQEDVSQK